MKKSYKSAYNKRAFDNHIRRTARGEAIADLLYIVLLTIGLIFSLCMMASEDVKYPLLCLALLFACGDYYYIKNYLEIKERERNQQHNMDR